MTLARVVAFVVQFASRSKAIRFALAFAIVRIVGALAAARSISSVFGRDLHMEELENSGRLKVGAFAQVADLALPR